jgi:3-oxoacyl-[acyl-carrier-protein] synthase-3|tara:strand:+ start:334 stop:1407 length:1074 start_codon:yes stop_codon:yes gene_type:complete
MGIEITGWGKCIPPVALTNKDLESFLDTNDEWITSRTGVKERRISHVGLTDLATVAAKKALASANKSSEDIDAVIMATCTPEYIIPSTASRIQEKIGNNGAAAFDINSACTGFVYGLTTAYSLVKSGMMKNILLVGAEIVTFYVDYTQRDIAVLFGDGAAAVVIEEVDGDSKMHSSKLGCDPTLGEALILNNFGTSMEIKDPKKENNILGIQFQGKEIFKNAVKSMSQYATEVIEEANLTIDDIDVCIPHQANLRILEATAKRCGLPMEKMIINVEKYGNTSAASIPIALTEALEEKKIKSNAKILFLAFGGGLTCAASIIDWGSRTEHLKTSDASLPECTESALEILRRLAVQQSL